MSTSPEGGEGRLVEVVPVFALGTAPVSPTPVDPDPEFNVDVVVVADGDVVVVGLCCEVVVVGGIVVVVVVVEVVVVVVVVVAVIGIVKTIGGGGGTETGVMTVSAIPPPHVDSEAELLESPA